MCPRWGQRQPVMVGCGECNGGALTPLSVKDFCWERGMGEGCGASSVGGFIKCCQQYHLRFRQNQISCGSSLTVSSGDWKSASFSLVVGEGLGRGGWASDGLRDATQNQHVSSRFSMVQLWAKVRISQETQFDFYITSNLDQNLPYKHCIYKPS